MKKVAIVTHCIANNFGANLQALSTACYLKEHQYEPVFITWGDYLSNNTPREQVEMHTTFLRKNDFVVSAPCHTAEDFLNVIAQHDIRNVIVGSDCVLTYRSQRFPYVLTRRGFKKVEIPADYNFPNPFWLPYLKGRKDIHRFLMSASCGGSKIGGISRQVREEMHNLLSCFDYISLRDSFTRRFVHQLLPERELTLTPDPVFGFNKNVTDIPTKESMKEAYHLPDNYLVISFYQQNWPQQEWADRFMEEAHKHGYTCVGVPMPQDGRNSLFDVNVELPIDPLQWYALIKYSGGYIGNNMHPVIVALHNAIPFFSYNIHGESLLRNRIQLLWTSKEYDLLKRFHLQQYLAPQPMLNLISPKKVVQKMVHFDRTHALTVSKQLEGEYVQMMEQICSRFI